LQTLPKNVDEKNECNTLEKCWRKNVGSVKCWWKNIDNSSKKILKKIKINRVWKLGKLNCFKWAVLDQHGFIVTTLIHLPESYIGAPACNGLSIKIFLFLFIYFTNLHKYTVAYLFFCKIYTTV
jgi:hypothetical protein